MNNSTHHYQTAGNITIYCTQNYINYPKAIDTVVEKLNDHLGLIFASGFEFPGRYTRWDIGFYNPPLVITTQQNKFFITALNDRGKIILGFIHAVIKNETFIENYNFAFKEITGSIIASKQTVPEELRSKQPSIFSLLRKIIHLFYAKEEKHLGLFGAFGYDLAFQFEPLKKRLDRKQNQRDLVLYLPDEIFIVDHQSKQAYIKTYDFYYEGQTTENFVREGQTFPFIKTTQNLSFQSKLKSNTLPTCDHQKGEYAQAVKKAKEAFKCGDLFEVVLSQTFYNPIKIEPAILFKRLCQTNPAPYASFINLGQQEYLVGASPEMFIRVTGKRVETCPISGTIARGKDAIADANQILRLLNSNKDTAELTMCTDVDRNDKSRICEPGSVNIIGRKQIEMYSRLIHTVDHVEGILRKDFDAIDAFLTHTWVVTVTGAPKIWAMQFIEDHEKTPRGWYGGAIGWLQFNGDINTGLTLRTLHIDQGMAEMRVGATLLFDSDPEAEEEETKLKASAFIGALNETDEHFIKQKQNINLRAIYKDKRILLVDHQDSFVHTLANYLRQTGAEVITLRAGFSKEEFEKINPHLMVLSPGPGSPKDFALSNTIQMALDKHLPIFGVCLGLQGLVEYFGGTLKILDYPMHGKTSKIKTIKGKLFENYPQEFQAGRYHSLYADKNTFPKDLIITAESEDSVVMAIEHKHLPIAAVQFHPESILSMENNVGLRLIFNMMKMMLG